MKQQFNSLLRCCLFTGVLFVFIHAGCSPAKHAATGAASDEAIAAAVAADNWVFSANQALPQRGRSRNLTGGYEVACRKDTLLFYLPYFGRAYSATIGETTSPLNFKTTDFSFSKTNNDKGRWNITVVPKDYREVQSCDFTLYENGTAQLNVQMTNRSSISFSGFVRPGK
ncbi:DUF4251 domain-containing protein [Agriterribacter sp.]|uniref:DUF4251 domain-containing protein n=1 Tax=Agriterribacter sp. TaxID=2821509 RepID=UPI002B7FCF57|nr:DUF4251 domain-containing protein [Agriterribacter sp.]HRO44995.1 DUF4251 domain-containing protein [Agriterribacter sp.]HRQ15732.1 DUF4251 domain-containing protein [Agriterribacter sp.]